MTWAGLLSFQDVKCDYILEQREESNRTKVGMSKISFSFVIESNQLL